MTVQTVTLQLPEELLQRFRDAAKTMNQPLEAILYQTIQHNLPPSLADLPSELQGELTPLLTMNDQALWALAQKALPRKAWKRHQVLLAQAEQGPLSSDEQEELINLRSLTDQFVLKRSYALAVLKWRGYSFPTLPALPRN